MVIVYRIKAGDFSICEVGKKSCKKSKVKFPEAVDVARLFKKHGKLNLIADEKDSRFLKGGFSGGNPIGARI